MKFATSAEELKLEIYASVDKIPSYGDLRVRQLKKLLPQIRHEVIFAACLQIYEDKSRGDCNYQDQKLAGEILLEFKPPCPLSMEEILFRTLPNWNRSVKELPYYLRHVFGQRTVIAVVEELSMLSEVEEERENMRTVKWWLLRRIDFE